MFYWFFKLFFNEMEDYSRLAKIQGYGPTEELALKELYIAASYYDVNVDSYQIHFSKNLNGVYHLKLMPFDYESKILKDKLD